MSESTDILISRVVDGVATPTDWKAVEALAAKNSDIWREIALAQRIDRALVAAVSEAATVASGVDLQPIASPAGSLLVSQSSFTRRLKLAGAWGGWAAAAAVALAFLGQAGSGSSGTRSPVIGSIPASQASLSAPIANAAMYLDEYLDRGRQEGTVINELPDKVLIETTKAPDGQGYDVVYVRQIMERARVQDFYRFSNDETGSPTPVKVNFFVRGAPPI